MKYNINERQAERGVSLVELLIVIAMIAVVSTIAMMQFGSSKQQFKRQNVAQELKSAFERARFDSVKRRAAGSNELAKVVIDTTSFTLVTDTNKNGLTTDAVDSVATDFSGQNVSITSTLALPATVYFNRRGEVIDSGGASISPSFLVCNPSCTISGGNSNATSSNASLILVTPTGTVNLLPGGAAIPTFAAPSPLTPITNTSGIRNEVIINGN